MGHLNERGSSQQLCLLPRSVALVACHAEGLMQWLLAGGGAWGSESSGSLSWASCLGHPGLQGHLEHWCHFLGSFSANTIVP